LSFLKQLHESQVAYLKLQAHTASLQSLKECYCRYAHMLDGARTMFNAYQQTTTKRDSIDQVKLGLKECTQVSRSMSYIIEIVIQKYYVNIRSDQKCWHIQGNTFLLDKLVAFIIA
jgi:hypothetical protein